jgi:hypothetical protein
MKTANYTNALQGCYQKGGMLWWPRNASEELAVEKYFGC